MLRRILLTVAVLLTFAQAGLAQDEDISFNTLLAALEAANLSDLLAGQETFTLFAPTDTAFDAVLAELDLTAEELLADTGLVSSVLLYHTVRGEVTAADLTPVMTTVDGRTLTVEVGESVTINEGRATVIQADIVAANGIIHAIDAVLLPPTEIPVTGEMELVPVTEEASEDVSATEEAVAEPPATEEATEDEAPDTLLFLPVDAIAANNDLSIMLTALTAAERTDIFFDQELTVFAPTDEAFAEALETLGLSQEELLADVELLQLILDYHIIEGSVISTEIDTSTLPLELVALSGDAVILDVIDEAIILNDDEATVTSADLLTDQGVVHIIDAVLIPPALQS